jgi:hypothetical protein
MYLVFDLPPVADHVFPSAHTVAFWLHREFERWSERYQIEHRTKYHKNRLRLIFSSDQEYNFFMITWNPDMMISSRQLDSNWAKFEVVNLPKY